VEDLLAIIPSEIKRKWEREAWINQQFHNAALARMQAKYGTRDLTKGDFPQQEIVFFDRGERFDMPPYAVFISSVGGIAPKVIHLHRKNMRAPSQEIVFMADERSECVKYVESLNARFPLIGASTAYGDAHAVGMTDFTSPAPTADELKAALAQGQAVSRALNLVLSIPELDDDARRVALIATVAAPSGIVYVHADNYVWAMEQALDVPDDMPVDIARQRAQIIRHVSVCGLEGWENWAERAERAVAEIDTYISELPEDHAFDFYVPKEFKSRKF
jgi:hypothetical protein